MRCAVWYSNYGFPQTNFEFPYKAQSPTLYKKTLYKTDEDVMNEVYRIIEESKSKGFDIGQSLYYQMPFFCDPKSIISQWCLDIITDYFTVKKYHVPIASSIDTVNPFMIDCFSIIDDELIKINKYESKKNGS